MPVSTPPRPYNRIVPIIIAVALFMENMDSTVIATSLPAIAQALGTNPLALKLAVTSYLLALAICIPASGWVADRYGARKIFRIAIGVFVLGSIGCALSGSLEQFVLARIIQGMGGAMMTPVGRLILLRSIDKRVLVNAMSLVTITALVGPISGPPLGGFITTYASWHWIFIINVPIGLVGIALATLYIPDVRAERPEPFDFVGFVLSGLGVGGLAFGLSVMGLAFLPVGVVAALIGVGAISSAAYVVHARRTAVPILDLTLFKLPTFRASVFGGFMFRLGIGALPFLLPLLLQLGFGLTPFQSGLITFTGALGAIFMKAAAASVLRRFGYRRVLLYNSLISSAFLAACAFFVPGMPYAGDGCHPAQRRLFSFAAIHQHQHHRLCRARAAAVEQGDGHGLGGAAIVAVDRRRRRRAHRRDHLAAQTCGRDGRRRFPAGFSRGQHPFGLGRPDLLAPAARCRHRAHRRQCAACRGG